MRRRLIPTYDRLSSALSYDPQTGELRWALGRPGKAKAGTIAGTYDHATGGIAVQLDGHRYQAHHLAWYLWHRVWPVHQILFRDKNPHNLRGTNLYSVEEVYSSSSKAVYARTRRERRARIRAEKQEIERLRLPPTDSVIVFDEAARKWSVQDPADRRYTIRQFDNPEEARTFALERQRISTWLFYYDKTFKLRPGDDLIRAGTDVYTETYEEIAEILAYDPDNGQFYYRRGGHGPLRADYMSTTGRQIVSLFGRYFSVAMMAWFLTHRVWPKPKQIGWRDGDKFNNKLSNLIDLKAL